jgi:MprA protease rhombosortase-interaction domain-containing protein
MAALSLGLAAFAPAANATLIGPTAYTGFSGSPFDGVSFSSFELEDFEDGSLNTPGVSPSTGFVLGPGFGLTDSVENAPDGCNPSGLGGGSHSCAGYSYYPNGSTSITFTFSGTLPTHAGIVWTDVGYVDGDSPPNYTGAGNVIFEAFDQGGFSLGTIGPDLLGDGAAAPTAAEDRFYGAINALGISKITISMPNSGDWEVDHLQYGVESVPEPTSAALLLSGGLAAFALRRRLS